MIAYKVGMKVRTKGDYKHTIRNWKGSNFEEYEVLENKYIWKTNNILYPIISKIDCFDFHELLKGQIAWRFTKIEDLKETMRILKKNHINDIKEFTLELYKDIKKIAFYVVESNSIRCGYLDILQAAGYEVIEIENPIAQYSTPLYKVGETVLLGDMIVRVTKKTSNFYGTKYDLDGSICAAREIPEALIDQVEEKSNSTKLMYRGYDVEEVVSFYEEYKDYDIEGLLGYREKYEELKEAVLELKEYIK